MQSIAMTAFGWTPGEFWAATPHDWSAALEGAERQRIAADKLRENK